GRSGGAGADAVAPQARGQSRRSQAASRCGARDFHRRLRRDTRGGVGRHLLHDDPRQGAMIKLIICGLWACAVTLASSYAVVYWQTGGRASAAPDAKHEEPHEGGGGAGGGLEAVKTRMISVPIIADGAIQGYVLAQFSFTVDGSLMKRMPVKPDLVFL